MPPRTPPLPTTALTKGLYDALLHDYKDMQQRLERGAQLERTSKVTQWWQSSNAATVFLKATCVSQDQRSVVHRNTNTYTTNLSLARLSPIQKESAEDCLRGLQEWDTIKEHAAKLDDLAFSECAAVQRLASKCVKEIGKDLSADIVPDAWQHICNGSCDCGDYRGGGGLWCKHVAALICSLIRKLNGSGFLYLKLLGVDVYELAKADAEVAEEERAAKRHMASKPQASGAQEDPICLE